MADAPTESPDIELLHPFYLDTDMSMAFAAALAGGVALTREEVEREDQQSQAVKNLRGNLRAFGLLGGLLLGSGEAGRESTEAETAASASRLVRQHTESSIFIALHDELRRSGRLLEAPDFSKLRPGEIVSMQLGPAVAPLRRVVDQILRLLDVVAPFAAEDEGQQGSRSGSKRRKRARAKQAAVAGDDDGEVSLRQIRNLFRALRDDLDRSGMVDVVVKPEDGPGVVLTLDTRLASDQTIELLHTSRFTVIGKVTQVWENDEEIVNLYRRSVISLVPALTQSVTWWMFAFLFGMASAIDPKEAENAAKLAAGLEGRDWDEEDEATSGKEDPGSESDQETEPAETANSGDEGDNQILIGDVAAEALAPVVNGPALQILPLAICM